VAATFGRRMLRSFLIGLVGDDHPGAMFRKMLRLIIS